MCLQPEPPTSPLRGPQRVEEEDEGDLNKALGVQTFQQILNPAPRVPDEQHRAYNEEDFECEQSPAPRSPDTATCSSPPAAHLTPSWSHTLSVDSVLPGCVC